MRSISVELELAACDDHGRSADLHPPDLVAKADTGVACEMDRERPRGGAGRRILLDAEAGCEHPGLPTGAGAGEAADADPLQLAERGEVGVQPGDRGLAVELDVDVEGR